MGNDLLVSSDLRDARGSPLPPPWGWWRSHCAPALPPGAHRSSPRGGREGLFRGISGPWRCTSPSVHLCSCWTRSAGTWEVLTIVSGGVCASVCTLAEASMAERAGEQEWDRDSAQLHLKTESQRQQPFRMLSKRWETAIPPSQEEQLLKRYYRSYLVKRRSDQCLNQARKINVWPTHDTGGDRPTGLGKQGKQVLLSVMERLVPTSLRPESR